MLSGIGEEPYASLILPLKTNQRAIRLAMEQVLWRAFAIAVCGTF